MNNFLKNWCSKYWLYVEYILSFAMLILLILNWNTWKVPNKFACSIGIFIGIHVVEEWKIPGGFHYQYNLLKNSSYPNQYPLNQKSDMFTNLGGTIFYSILTFFPGNNGLVALAAVFGLGESIIHTILGIAMKKRFKSKGKRTIYGPGSITAYLYLFTVSIQAILYILHTGFDMSCFITFIVLLVVSLGVFIQGFEKWMADEKTIYSFPNAKYYEKFL